MWESVDTAETELDALRKASRLTRKHREEWIRIVTPDGKVI